MSTIEIPNKATAAQLGVALRALLVALGGYAVGKGWLTSDLADALVAVGLIIGPMIYAQVRAHFDHKNKVAMADALPDSVARVK